MITKNEAVAYLSVIKNLSSELKKIEDMTISKFQEAGFSNNDIYYMLKILRDDIQMTNDSDRNSIDTVGKLYLKNLENGKYGPVPQINIDPISLLTEVSLALEDGSSLVAFAISPDRESFQVGTGFVTEDKQPFDLTMSEIKRGDLAIVNKMPANNMDIDIYTWSNPYTEDYTDKSTIYHDDISKIIESEIDNER